MNFPFSWLKPAVGLLVSLAFAGVAVAADFTVQRWRVAEIPLTGSVTYADPFQDVDVTATFTGPGGETLVRPAFWDGGNSWKIRFAPTVTGEWSMTTISTDPANAGLNGITRTVQCDAYTGNLPIYQHGFVKPSTNGHYFTYADGTPFFYLGDTHWLMIHERFDTSNVPGIPSQFKYVVDKRVTQGFTVFQSEAIHIPHGGTGHLDLDEEPHADLRDGLSAEDLPGFANVDRKFAYIAEKGLVHANSMITWTADPIGSTVLTDAYMAKLGRYWAARYAAYPVFWTVAQEIDPDLYGAARNEQSKWDSGSKGVTDNDPYDQPLGAHMQTIGHGINHPSESFFGSKPYHKWWPMQMQYTTPDNRWHDAARDFYLTGKPTVLYESPYDTFWTNNKGARSSGYRAIQTGMCGYGYGANGVWSDLTRIGDYGTDYFMPSGFLSWYDGANLPTGDQMTYLRNFYGALEWWNLVPRFDDPAWCSFPDPYHSLLSSIGNSTYAVYFFGNGTTTGAIKGMASTPYEASWYNPRTGNYLAIGGITPTVGQWTLPARPTADDWILLVKQNPNAVVTTPANGASLSASMAPQLSWTDAGAPPDRFYQVYFGPAANHDAAQPNGNLARLTPQGGTTGLSVPIPSALPAGTYFWTLAVTDPSAGTTTSYTSAFTVAGFSILVDNGSFETTGAGGPAGWAHVASHWNPTNTTSPYQQNSLTPVGGAHFTATSQGGGVWYALMNANNGSLHRDLATTVNAGDTVSVTFFGGRARTGLATSAGGVFSATFLVGTTPYAMQVDTTTLANNAWQAFTLTKTVTNSGNLSLDFGAVSGDPWLDNIGSVTLTTEPVLSVAMASPVDGGQVLSGASATATATVSNGIGPYTVSYEITAPSGASTVAGTSNVAPYSVLLVDLEAGIYQIRATVTDSATTPVTTTSLPQTFRVAPYRTVPVQNPSFEIPGVLSANGWARNAAGWNSTVVDNNFQQLSEQQWVMNCHLTKPSPNGGSWYSLMNANIGTISQNLATTVNVGDTVSVTFYGGRGREVMSTNAGGVFNAAFLVGATPYAMAVDTTTLPYDSWQSFTLTKTVTNAGPLSLQFSKSTGDPWLDNISKVTITAGSPYTSWINGQSGVPSGQDGFSSDPNGDGVANGMVWILGGTNPMDNGHALLPIPTAAASGALTLVFDCLKQADRGPTTLEVEYGNDMMGWLKAEVPDISGTVNGVIFTIAGIGPLQVTAEIPKVNAADTKLFGRLKATNL
ncbi:MAG: DUF4038 domain-containing protein [Verrucomicrobiota bacterium]